MGMSGRTLDVRVYPAPGWLTWAVLAGVVLVYAGERIVDAVPAVRAGATGLGAMLALGAVSWRAAAWRRAPEGGRPTELLFLLMYAGCVVGLGLFGLAGGHARLGIHFDDPGTAARVRTALTVLASVVLSLSLLSMLAAQWAAGSVGSWRRDPGAVDRLRISELAASGLMVAMAGATLVLVGYVAGERDRTLDASYFRTSSPGSAVAQITGSMGGGLRVMLFFPPANPVEDEVSTYFRSLASTGNVEVESYDRLASPELAERFRVSRDGTVILASGDRTERITLPVDIREARPRLRSLDQEVRGALMRVARDARTVYLTVGHGELNDPVATGPEEEAPFRSIEALRTLFLQMNYRVEDLGVHTGLGTDVPADAAMVLVLGPSRPFLEPELEALRRYLDRGGSLLLALEPGSGFDLGPLRDRLGVEFYDIPLADDQQHLRQRGNPTDRRLIVTDRFTTHAAVSTLSDAGLGAGVLLMGAGYVEPHGESSRANIVLRSLPSTFADVNRNFEFESGVDERRQYGLIAAVEGASTPDGGATGNGGMRALVIADSELFSDAVVTSLGTNAALVADAVSWLGREEDLAGQTESEEDIPIVHTRTQDVAWFYSTILGAPSLVLLLGLLGVRRRRSAGARRRRVS